MKSSHTLLKNRNKVRNEFNQDHSWEEMEKEKQQERKNEKKILYTQQLQTNKPIQTKENTNKKQ